LTTPTQTPYLPVTPDQIAEAAIQAAEAGAALVHIHVRNPEDGRPSARVELYRKAAEKIKLKSKVVVGITTGGSPDMTAEQRIEPVRILKPELASFNLGPVVTSLRKVTRRYKDSDFKFAWEKDYLNLAETHIMQNSFREFDVFLKNMNENGTKPECECWDVGHIYNAGYYFKEGQIPLPVWLQFVTGTLGSIGSDISDILHMRNTAERLLGAGNYHWSLIAVGPAIFGLAPVAINLGGHVRVGFEDNIFIEKGKLARSNAEQVERIVRIAREMGREIATPDEARKILGLKGIDNVNF
jgi:uncharacterized protein (DUF849 family)